MDEWYCTSAITADTMMNSTSNTRMQESCFFSDMSLTMLPLITSIVSVDDDVSTSDERVDIDADSTSTMTMPMRMSGSDESIVGMMES